MVWICLAVSEGTLSDSDNTSKQSHTVNKTDTLSLSAEDVGAYHQRKRWFGLAHRKRSEGNTSPYTEHDGSFRSKIRRSPQEEISDNSKRENRVRQFEGSGSPGVLSPELVQGDELLQRCKDAWEVESRIPRNAHGVSYQVDRIKRLGNAVVPLQAKVAFEFLAGLQIKT
jgi:hypothetical protein